MKHSLSLRILWTVAIVLAAGANGYGQTDTLEKVKPLVTDARDSSCKFYGGTVDNPYSVYQGNPLVQ